MNQPTLDENGRLATVVVDAKKLTELANELVALREQVKALNSVRNAAMDVLNHRHLVRDGSFNMSGAELRQWEAELEAALSDALDKTVNYGHGGAMEEE